MASNLKKRIIKFSLLMLLGFGLIPTSYAITTVHSNNCQRLHGLQRPFLLVIQKGKPINKMILQCANAANLPGAIISGIGAVNDPTLAYFNLTTHQYQDKTFKGLYELVALNGNITQFQGKRVVHLHAVIGDDQYHTFGGHLMNGTVGVTAEITITPLTTIPKRQFDDKTRLNLIKSN